MENIEKPVSEGGNSCRDVIDQTLPESDDDNNSITPRKRSWMFRENIPEKENGGCLLQQSSLEEGELTPTMLTLISDSSYSEIVEDKKKRSKKLNYSSFIETSKEDGECSTTFTDSDDDLDVTVVEKVPVSNDHGIKDNEGMSDDFSEEGFMQECAKIYDNITDSINESIGKSDTNISAIEVNETVLCTHGTTGVECKISLEGNEPAKKVSQKRKLSSENYYESTPKRRHLFIPEDNENKLLSPIVKVNNGILTDEKSSDMETPIIKSKFQGNSSNICSSTPLSKSEDSTPLKSSSPCSDSQLSCKNEDHNINSKNDDESSLGQNDVSNMITVDELIAEITQLCEGYYSPLDSTEEENACNVSSESEVTVNMDDHESNVTNEISTFVEEENDNDTTITDEAEVKLEDRINEVGTAIYNSDSDESVNLEASFAKDDKLDKSITESEKCAGRFKDINLVSKIDTEVDEDKTNVRKDKDVCNISYEDYAGDILCLESKYDDVDARYVDETLLEKSHFVANLEKSIIMDCVNESAKESLKDYLVIDVKVEEAAEDIEPPIEVNIDISEQVKIEPLNNDFECKNETTVSSAIFEAKGHVCEGFDWRDFDADKHRKRAVLPVEREACRRWGSTNVGTPNSDINLTTSTTFHKNMLAAGDAAGSGFLECDSVVSTYMCEDNMHCKLNRDSCTISFPGYMKSKFIHHRLENQKQLLDEMRHMSLSHLKGEIERKKSAMRQGHIAEFNRLVQRHRMQVDEFMYQTGNIFNSRQIQKDLCQMQQKHRVEMTNLKLLHQNKFSSLCAYGKETLNKLVADYNRKLYPLDEIIEQLNNVQCHTAGLLYEYGPPVFVGYCKRPCRDTNWELSAIRTRVPAGIAQAVTLEEDVYDYYYS